MQLKDGMPVGSILHRLSGTGNQVRDVTPARLQACDSMHTCSSVAAGVAATREAIFHGDRITCFYLSTMKTDKMMTMMMMKKMMMMTKPTPLRIRSGTEGLQVIFVICLPVMG